MATVYRVTTGTPFGPEVRDFDTLEAAEREVDAQRAGGRLLPRLTTVEVTTKVPRTYIATTADGRYGLAAPADGVGVYGLYLIVAETTEDWDDEMTRLVGPYADYWVGDVSDPENLEYAADVADEEMAHLVADAKAEFG